MVSEDKARIMITLPKCMIAEIDKRRSAMSRSLFVYGMLRQYFGKKG